MGPVRPSRRLGLVLACALWAALCQRAGATDLVEAWRAAQQHDLDYAAARAAWEAGASRRDQAHALWRPSVKLSGTAAFAGSDSTVRGARFSAPGLGTSSGVGFDTSIDHGALGRVSLDASLPLYDRERAAQGRQLELSADVADLAWAAAQQTLMLETSQRYLDVVSAQEALRVARRQQDAVDKALVETKDRFRLGDVPITDTHEAAARAEAIAAQVIALETDLRLKQQAFADATGLNLDDAPLRPPADASTQAPPPALATCLEDARLRNLQLRMQQAAVEVARQEAAKSQGVLSPSVDLVAQLGRERLSGSGDFGNASNSAGNRMIGLQVSIPLYTGGMRGARAQEALHGIEKAQAQADRAQQQVAQQVRAAWLGLSVGSARVAALAQALASTRSRLDATRLGHRVGDRTTLDLLNAENDAASAELALLQARIDLMIDQLRLDAATGRLDETGLRAVNAWLEPPAAR